MPTGKRKWSAEVTRSSDALDLEDNVFRQDDPRRTARSLKRSAERSRRRKSSPCRSAMSMPTFDINRAGRNRPEEPRSTLEAARHSLRRLFHRR